MLSFVHRQQPPVETWEPLNVDDELVELPEWVDPELWFECPHDAGARDYLLNEGWHTFPGRMPAWCAGRRVSFRVSQSELPSNLPAVTRYWVAGFLVGNVPRQPDEDDDGSPAMARWQENADQFLATGFWPPLLRSEVTIRWIEDARVLAELGRVLADVELPVVQVRLPRELADQAAAAWDRDDDHEGLLEESTELREYHGQAAVLALIGRAVHDAGHQPGEAVLVELSTDLIARAVAASVG